ncbi:MAG TPA: hypothetical protein VHP31_00925 [Caproicibacter sp.]|nr:hypothetical protein [Caproicibacter sp.]
MELKFPLLTADDIEVKVKKVTAKGAIALLYKTARTDMNTLDSVVGPLNWKCSYHDVKGNLYCEISIFDTDKKEWVSKEDCGIESREDDEGNQHKGEASDAFKRAGFKWGIGRELYTAPFTFISCATKQRRDGKTFELENPFERFSVKEIGYDDSGKINALSIVDSKGKTVYELGKKIPAQKPQTQPQNPFTCPECGKPITKGVKYKGQEFTPEQLYKTFGRCAECLRKKVEADKKS